MSGFRDGDTIRTKASARQNGEPSRLAWPKAVLMIATLCCVLWGFIWAVISIIAR